MRQLGYQISDIVSAMSLYERFTSSLVAVRPCPLCTGMGLTTSLRYFQVNMEEAVLMCPSKGCPYPIGCSTDTVDLFIKRVPPKESYIRKRKRGGAEDEDGLAKTRVKNGRVRNPIESGQVKQASIDSQSDEVLNSVPSKHSSVSRLEHSPGSSVPNANSSSTVIANITSGVSYVSVVNGHGNVNNTGMVSVTESIPSCGIINSSTVVSSNTVVNGSAVINNSTVVSSNAVVSGSTAVNNSMTVSSSNMLHSSGYSDEPARLAAISGTLVNTSIATSHSDALSSNVTSLAMVVGSTTVDGITTQVPITSPLKSSKSLEMLTSTSALLEHLKSRGLKLSNESTRVVDSVTNFPSVSTNAERLNVFTPYMPYRAQSDSVISSVNGSTVNGSTVNGSTVSGSAVNGSTVNGSAVNGSTVSGSAVNGSAVNGSTVNSSAVNGSAVNGSTVNGSAVNGSAVNGSAVNGSCGRATVAELNGRREEVVNGRQGTGIELSSLGAQGRNEGGMGLGRQVQNGRREKGTELVQRGPLSTYLQWENVDALCWLDVVLTLLTHNNTVRALLSASSAAPVLNGCCSGSSVCVEKSCCSGYSVCVEKGCCSGNSVCLEKGCCSGNSVCVEKGHMHDGTESNRLLENRDGDSGCILDAEHPAITTCTGPIISESTVEGNKSTGTSRGVVGSHQETSDVSVSAEGNQEEEVMEVSIAESVPQSHRCERRRRGRSVETSGEGLVKCLMREYNVAQWLHRQSVDLRRCELLCGMGRTVQLETSAGNVTVRMGGGSGPTSARLFGAETVTSIAMDTDREVSAVVGCSNHLADSLEPFNIRNILCRDDSRLVSMERVTLEAERLEKLSRTTMSSAREHVYDAVAQSVGCVRGKNDSSLVGLMCLLEADVCVEEGLRVSYDWSFSCTACGHQRSDSVLKSVPTMLRVDADFSMTRPSFSRPCFQCNAPDQRLNITLHRLPDTFFVHFLEGLSHTEFSELDFEESSEERDGLYTVTGVIRYRPSPDHFIAWLRHPLGDEQWMECDDLKNAVCKYSRRCPDFPPAQAHIVMWERQSADVVEQLRHRRSAAAACSAAAAACSAAVACSSASVGRAHVAGGLSHERVGGVAMMPGVYVRPVNDSGAAATVVEEERSKLHSVHPTVVSGSVKGETMEERIRRNRLKFEQNRSTSRTSLLPSSQRVVMTTKSSSAVISQPVTRPIPKVEMNTVHQQQQQQLPGVTLPGVTTSHSRPKSDARTRGRVDELILKPLNVNPQPDNSLTTVLSQSQSMTLVPGQSQSLTQVPTQSQSLTQVPTQSQSLTQVPTQSQSLTQILEQSQFVSLVAPQSDFVCGAGIPLITSSAALSMSEPTIHRHSEPLTAVQCGGERAGSNSGVSVKSCVTSNPALSVAPNVTSNGVSSVTSNTTLHHGVSSSTYNGTSNTTLHGVSSSTYNGTSDGTLNVVSNGASNVSANVACRSNDALNITSHGSSKVMFSGTLNVASNGTSSVTSNGTSNGTSNATFSITSNLTSNVTTSHVRTLAATSSVKSAGVKRVLTFNKQSSEVGVGVSHGYPTAASEVTNKSAVPASRKSVLSRILGPLTQTKKLGASKEGPGSGEEVVAGSTTLGGCSQLASLQPILTKLGLPPSANGQTGSEMFGRKVFAGYKSKGIKNASAQVEPTGEVNHAGSSGKDADSGSVDGSTRRPKVSFSLENAFNDVKNVSSESCVVSSVERKCLRTPKGILSSASSSIGSKSSPHKSIAVSKEKENNSAIASLNGTTAVVSKNSNHLDTVEDNWQDDSHLKSFVEEFKSFDNGSFNEFFDELSQFFPDSIDQNDLSIEPSVGSESGSAATTTGTMGTTTCTTGALDLSEPVRLTQEPAGGGGNISDSLAMDILSLDTSWDDLIS